MTWLRAFFDWLGRSTALIFLTPCISVIGNNSEEIFFGLIKARREGKRLVILYPFELPGRLRFPITNREIFDVSSPYRLELPAAALFLLRGALTLIYGAPWVLSRVARKLGLGSLPGRFTHPDIGVAALWQPGDGAAEFRWDVVESYRWREELRKPLEVGLAPGKQALAHKNRVEMGVPEDAWFVGLHVRESGFYNDAGQNSCRNATIENYLPAIREITARGGWVIRLGDKTMTPLAPMHQLLDYPHSPYKSHLMDLYLLSRCRFFIGMSSGIMDTALLFHRPMVLTNLTNMTFIYPRREGDRGIPKHVFSKELGRFLSLRELLESPWDAQHFLALGDAFEMHENTPDEIREVVVEFLDSLDCGAPALTPLQLEANRIRIACGRKLLSQPLFQDSDYDRHHRYRIASRLESSLGALSPSFLEKHWDSSPRPNKTPDATPRLV